MLYLALPGGPGGFTRNSSCSVLLGYILNPKSIENTRLSLSMAPLSNGLLLYLFAYSFHFLSNFRCESTS